MKRALVVGINEFLYHPEATLRGCKNDALHLRAFLELELGLAADQVVFLADRQAEAGRVLEVLQTLVSRTRAGDYLAFSFSSHGTQVADVDGDEPDGWHEALCCTDIMSDGQTWVKGLILDKTLREVLQKAHADARIEVWLDTCYAGGVKQLANMGLTYSRARMLRHPRHQYLPRKRLLGLAPPDNIVIWQACREEQTSADTFIDGDWGGAFTHHFLRQYRPDLSRQALLERVKAGLFEGGYAQVPQITYGDKKLAAGVVGS